MAGSPEGKDMGRPGGVSSSDPALSRGPGGAPAVIAPPCREDGAALARLVYVSRAAPRLGTAEVYAIIRRAHAGNGAAGVTGALVFLDGWFAQALEGPGPGLDAIWARLTRDPRHQGIERRIRERGLCRLFACPMALRTAADLDPDLLAAFGYRPGFPVEAFPAAVLLEFLIAACRRHGLDKRRALS